MTGAFVTIDKVTRRFTSSAPWTEKLMSKFGVEPPPRTVHAVTNVSLSIKRGEALGLVGESGCGKSTLGRILCGIIPPSEGHVSIDGEPVTQGRTKATRRVQMVFQNPFASLNPRMPIGAAIGEGPLAHGLVSQAELGPYVRSWLERVGLPADVAERYPHQFSGGQRQRVAIARALAMQPDVLVCDEPVASLDVSIQAQILNLFLSLRDELDLTLLFISHDLGVVRHICDRVAVMYLGRIVEEADTKSIYEAPAHPYTRALLDSIPRLEADGSEAKFKAIAGELPSPLRPPAGCAFHERCPLAFDLCHRQIPVLGDIDSAHHHRAACHALRQASDAPSAA
jgi:peptide/nickel transport system ATP-binding protein